MCMDYISREEETQVNGIICLYDFQDFGLAQLRNFTPTNCRMFAALVQNCLPLRIKGLHVLFEPMIFYLGYSVVKPFLTAKLRSRIHFHGANLESLHQHIHPEFLPVEFGGQQPSVSEAAKLQKNFFIKHDEEITRNVAATGYKKDN